MRRMAVAPRPASRRHLDPRSARPGARSSPRHRPRMETVMSVRIVRLGTPRAAGEGTRIGTVRRPPRGVPKTEFARQNWYDVWFPTLAPTVETMKLGQQATTPAHWKAFAKRYAAEMNEPPCRHALDLLAALSQQ